MNEPKFKVLANRPLALRAIAMFDAMPEYQKHHVAKYLHSDPYLVHEAWHDLADVLWGSAGTPEGAALYEFLGIVKQLTPGERKELERFVRAVKRGEVCQVRLDYVDADGAAVLA